MRWGHVSSAKVSGTRERGASLVEAAMVLPLLIILFLGIVDFGVAISDYNQLRQGVRESTRRAVVADVGSDSSCPISGSPSGDTQKLVCLTKNKTGLDQTKVRVEIKFDSAYAEGDALIVCAQYPLSSISGLFGGLIDGIVVHTQMDMRIEKELDPGSLVAFQETAHPGGWSCG